MKSLAHKFQNASRLIRSPRLATAYARWLTAQGRPLVDFKGVRVGGFISFSEFWWWRRGLEPEDLAVISAVHASSGGRKVAVDVGANLGLFSLSFAAAGYPEIHSFEPIPETFKRLRANLAMNPKLAPKITANNCGLGSSEGSFTFVVSQNSPGTNRFGTDDETLAPDESRIECKVTTLDSYCQAHGLTEIDFLKMDVEGFECAVLRGASGLLGRGAVRFIYAEVVPDMLMAAGSSLEEFSKLVESFNFEPVVLRGDRSARLEPVSLDEALLGAGDRDNVLFRFRGRS